MGLLKGLVNLIIPVTGPQENLPQMSPKQYYNYLVSLRRRTPEQEAMLEKLANYLGK
jgi:hypothetical protein